MLAFALIAVLQSVRGHPLFKGTHDFPLYSPTGVATANEFQMIIPENIKDHRKGSSGQYYFNSVSPTLLENDDVVTVTFTSTTPATGDWIGAYSPSNVDITRTVPVKYGWCNDYPDYMVNGNGLITFNLTNLRADVKFYYFANGTAHPILVSDLSKTITFKNFNEPLRPRIVATGDTDVLKLLWSSYSSTQPMVRWGFTSGKYDYTAAAATSTIDQVQVCGSPAITTGWRDLGLIHTALLTGMNQAANMKVYYTFGDEATNDYSHEYILFAPPLPGQQPPTRPTTVVMFDDLGRGSTDTSYTWNEYGRPSILTIMSAGARIARGEIDAVYHGGDISYATGYIAVWDFFMDMLTPLSASVVYLTTVGNHESDWYNSASMYNSSDSGGECGVLTTNLLPMPAPATTNQPWWSYDVGLIHFVGMSTEHNYTIGTAQYQWLENDLATVDRLKTPWVIFGGHRAMYLNSDYGGSVSSDIYVMDELIENIEPLLWKYRVNLGFYGHNHVVQRQSAVLNKTVIQASTPVVAADGSVTYVHNDPQATVHMVIGTGGAAFTKNAVTPPPDWNELVMYEYGYAIVTAVNASYLDWQWVLSENDKVMDHMVITQGDPTKPWVL